MTWSIVKTIHSTHKPCHVSSPLKDCFLKKTLWCKEMFRFFMYAWTRLHLCVSACVCLRVCVCVCVSVCVFLCLSQHKFLGLGVFKRACVCVSLSMNVCLFELGFMFPWVCEWVYVCVCVCLRVWLWDVLTVVRHAHWEALLEAAVLTLVSVLLLDLAAAFALVVLKLQANGPPEKTLCQRNRSLSSCIWAP